MKRFCTTPAPLYTDMIFDKPIANWDEGVPLGNGHLGALLWGGTDKLRISLDRGDLWDKRQNPETLDNGFTYENLIQLVRAGDVDGIRARFENFYCDPLPTKIPAGAMELKFDLPCTKFKARMHLQEAVCRIDLAFSKMPVQMQLFMHANKPLGYLLIEGNCPAFSLQAPAFSGTFDRSKWVDGPAFDVPGALPLLGYPDAKYETADALQWFVQPTACELTYAVLAASKTMADNKRLIVYTVASCEDGTEWLAHAKQQLFDALEEGWQPAYDSHAAWWRNFWKESTLCLCDKESEKMWYRTNYLFASCSRKGYAPMPLQGLWTADAGNLAPWKGDYHHDLNTQMSYWHYLKANHLSEGESFLDFLWKLVPQAQLFAKTFFDAPGLCLPTVMSIDAKPLGGWSMYSINLVNQIWLCAAFKDYWLYTGNETFLREKVVPYFTQTAQCIERWLQPGSDGKLVLPLSSSPEIHDNRMEAWLTPNSNNDLYLLRYLFESMQEFSKLLHTGEAAAWAAKLALLDEVQTTEDGVLMLCKNERLMESHRHLAHAMSIYPLCQYHYAKDGQDKRIIDATIEDLERIGTGNWMGYSYTWMALLYCMQGNGEKAAQMLHTFNECFCSRNTFHLNGDFAKKGASDWSCRQFTLEGNMCAANALQEMLVQETDGIVRVFPAVPAQWRKDGASFCNLRVPGGVLLSAKIIHNATAYVQLEAQRDCTLLMKNCFSSSIILICDDGHEQHIVPDAKDILKITLCQGACVVLMPR